MGAYASSAPNVNLSGRQNGITSGYCMDTVKLAHGICTAELYGHVVAEGHFLHAHGGEGQPTRHDQQWSPRRPRARTLPHGPYSELPLAVYNHATGDMENLLDSSGLVSNKHMKFGHATLYEEHIAYPAQSH